ncbi:MAG: dihydroneopterin aldolase [Muribaculaceae bacterium]|nr:dihydroneopterin aldolase [Muribaculaceae bacterium]
MLIHQPISYIEIKGLKIYAYHGVEEQERIVGNDFEVNVTLGFMAENAMRTDRLDLTINYAEVVDLVQKEMAEPSKLLEHVTYRIYKSLNHRFPQINSGQISIYKLQPPVEAELKKTGFVYNW